MAKPTESELDEHLYELLTWQQFAHHLPGMTHTHISIIETNIPGNVSLQKVALYSKWLSVDPKASWSSVIQALENEDQHTIANNIRSKCVEQLDVQQTKTKPHDEAVTTERDCLRDLPDLSSHLSYFSEAIHDVIAGTNWFVDRIKTEKNVMKMASIRAALGDINLLVGEGYEYIAKIADVPHSFQYSINGESSWNDNKVCEMRLEKGLQSLEDCQKTFENLRYCYENAIKSCEKAVEELEAKGKGFRWRRGAAQGTLAVTGVGVGLSLMAGVCTLGIGTAVGLGITSVVALGGSFGVGAMREDYNGHAEKLKQLSEDFLQLKRATKLSKVTQEMKDSLLTILHNLDSQKCSRLLVALKDYSRAHSKISTIKKQLVIQKTL